MLLIEWKCTTLTPSDEDCPGLINAHMYLYAVRGSASYWKKKYLSKTSEYSDCSEISTRSFEFEGRKGIKVSRSQIPIVLSFASSIYKVCIVRG